MATCVPVRPWPWDDCWKLQTATQASPTRRKVCVKAGMPLDSCLTLPIALCRCINSVCDQTEECCHAAVLSIRSWRVPQQAFPAPPSRASPQDQVISTLSVSLHGQSKPVGMVTLVHTLFVWLFFFVGTNIHPHTLVITLACCSLIWRRFKRLLHWLGVEFNLPPTQLFPTFSAFWCEYVKR